MAGKKPKTATAEVLATEFGVTPRQIRNYARKGMPQAGRNCYPLEACRQWHQNFVESAGADPTLRQAEIRLKTAQAQVQELKVAEARGELLPASLVGRVWDQVVASFRSRALAIPRKAVMRLKAASGDAAREKILTDMVYEALNELARADYSRVIDGALQDFAQSDGRGEAASAPDRERMGGRAPRPFPGKHRPARQVEN